ncbi:MAG: YitT family protein [Streptococcaceae bacterium]|jgi:uncharacterized membrane-anchored protein YitT (DUF2179 family)|nr:YitT family protein [Streptococcaceae bacterium]
MNKFLLYINKYSQKLSAGVVYAILSAIAMNFFFEPGNIYASGINGLAQIIHTISKRWSMLNIPVSGSIWLMNFPLFFLAWRRISKKFTIFTVITVTLSVFFIRIMPETKLTGDPIINAVFGGVINGVGIGYVLRNGLSSGGLDIVSLSIQKKTGSNVGVISMSFNAVIVTLAGFLFDWKYALYTILTIFVSGKITDAVFIRQKKMQVMIITKTPHKVASCIQEKLRRGATIVHSAEGAYTHSAQAIVFTVVTAAEIPDLKKVMRFADDGAFVSIQENVKIIGNFYEEDF